MKPLAYSSFVNECGVTLSGTSDDRKQPHGNVTAAGTVSTHTHTHRPGEHGPAEKRSGWRREEHWSTGAAEHTARPSPEFSVR